MNFVGSRQQFACRAGVDIALPIEREVVTSQAAILEDARDVARVQGMPDDGRASAILCS
jgi:hypothetical protein